MLQGLSLGPMAFVLLPAGAIRQHLVEDANLLTSAMFFPSELSLALAPSNILLPPPHPLGDFCLILVWS